MALHISVGLLMGLVTLGIQYWAIQLTFHIGKQLLLRSSVCQMGHVMAIRSGRESLFNWTFSNKPLLGLLLTVFLQLIYLCSVFYVIFKTQPLSLYELILTLLSSSFFWAVEIAKWILRRKKIARRSQNSYVQYISHRPRLKSGYIILLVIFSIAFERH
jgi:Ca2+-transporting ATPase